MPITDTLQVYYLLTGDETHRTTHSQARAHKKTAGGNNESNLLAAMARALAQGGNRIWWLKKECACYIPELHTAKRKFK
jgi:hypothetical protein